MESNINRILVIAKLMENLPAIIRGFMNATREEFNPPINHRNKMVWRSLQFRP